LGIASGWNWDVVVPLGIAALCAGYLAAVGPLRARYQLGEPPTRRQVISFAAGAALLALTLLSPLDSLGRTALFSAHMAQLLLLNTVVAPLLLISLPEWLVLAALARLGGRGHVGGLGEGGTLLLWMVAALLFNSVFLFWHIGPIFEAGLRSEAIHDLASLAILLTGALRWWPLLTPTAHKTRLASPGQIVYVLLESLPIDIFAIALIFAHGPLYATYVQAPRLWGIGAMLDQQIAACIALIPSTFLDIILMSAIFFAWFRRMERDQEAQDERVAAMQQG
jgi:putative membrane protein